MMHRNLRKRCRLGRRAASYGTVAVATLFVLFLQVTASETEIQESSLSPYRIVIDGGSTGSRLHIFEFQHNTTTNKTSIVRRGSSRADVPLSDYAPSNNPSSSNSAIDDDSSVGTVNSTHVADHLIPLFEFASSIIPDEYHAHTKVTYQATAGMRLVHPEEQNQVYEALWQGLTDHPNFKFVGLKRDDIQTLSGEKEAYFGAVAANYLKGLIDVRLTMGENNEGISVEQMNIDRPLGAMDMGGASMQIVFWPHYESAPVEDELHAPSEGSESSSKCKLVNSNSCEDSAITSLPPNQLNSDDTFATSYLSYGVDQFRVRLWDTWVEECQTSLKTNCSEGNVIYNPCSFKGYESEWKGYTLMGTGDARKCAKEVRRLIPYVNDVVDVNFENNGRTIGGIKHPVVKGKFFAMSLFFFTLDCLRELSNDDALNLAWPTPSILELTNALDSLCDRHWQEDLDIIKDSAHHFTRADVLPSRCFESVYLVTLLRDGFGFDLDSRDITFTFLVDGSEVEWSLGLALSSFAEEEDPAVVILGNSGASFNEWRNKQNNEKDLDDINRTRTKVTVRNSNWNYFHDEHLYGLDKE